VGVGLLAGVLVVVGCAGGQPGTSAGTAGGGPGPSGVGVASPLPSTPDAQGLRWVDSTLTALSLREAVGQLVFQWIPGSYAATSSAEFLELEGWVVEDGIGGVAISIGTPLAYAHKLNALQDRAPIPLLVTSDFENGGPGMRINHSYALPTLLPQGGGTSFPPTMAFGAIREDAEAHVEELARITGVEARAVGVHLTFAPVLDVNSNPANPIINTRAFGEDPERVAELGAAYLRGARRGGVLTTAKHFPGHGDTEVDSHLNLPAVTADRERLDRVELLPFRRAVAEGVDAVMTAHVAVPGVLGEGGPPATFAPEFMTGLLREEMGFQGLLFTDALRMGALTERYGGGEAALLALEAGADVILIPEEVGEAIAAVTEAVEAGRISRERVDRSVRSILETKARLGLHRGRRVSLEAVGEVVGGGPHLAVAEEAAARSIVLPRDREGLVPVPPNAVERVLSVTYARFDDLPAGRTFDAQAAEYVPRLERLRLDERSGPDVWREAQEAASRADLVLVNVYLPPRAGAGSVAVPGDLAGFIRRTAAARPTVVLSFGSPYLLSAVPEVGSYLVAWGDREVSQLAGARALFGESRIDGVLPISLPPLHRRGEGLVREVVRAPAALRTDQLDETGIVAPGRRGGGGVGPPEEGGDSAAAPGTAGTRGDTGLPWGVGGGVVPPPLLQVGDLREVDPAAAGMSPGGLGEVDRILRAAVEAGVTPGAALAVGRWDRVVRLRGYGRLDHDPAAPPVDPATLYDLASLTKVVGTTSALLLLVDRGEVDLRDPVVRYLPGWDRGDPRKARVTVEDLLLHRGGLSPFRRWFLEMEGKAAYVGAIQDEALEYEPGSRTAYSDIGFMTLGLLVEAVDGRTLDRFLEEELFRPLGMWETAFRPSPGEWERVAPTELVPERGGLVRGVVHDENAHAMGGVAGHAGLFSSVRDLARFAMTFSVGRSPFRHASVQEWVERRGEDSTRALGWDTPSPVGSSAGAHFSPRSFGHTGFTGTSLWVDRDSGVWVVLLTNRVNPTRENSGHVPLRRAVHDAVASAVEGPPLP